MSEGSGKGYYSWESALLHSELGWKTKFTLLVVATHMNAHGEGEYPGNETISAQASMPVHVIAEAMSQAISQGWLIPVPPERNVYPDADTGYKLGRPYDSRHSKPVGESK